MGIEQGAVKNLDQIQESDGPHLASRILPLLVVGLGGAAVVFAAMALGGQKSKAPASADPLAELVERKGKAAPPRAEIAPEDVTFPGILSDKDSPTTALAALRPPPGAKKVEVAVDPRSAVAGTTTTTGAGVTAPPPADRLPVVPLPAKSVLDPSPVVTKPRDTLTKVAAESVASSGSQGPSAPAGREGGYQLQISSFRSQTEANAFSEQLRARGHKAYVSEATVSGRGTWYRVRVGPFPSQQAATAYRSTFESKEHVVPFVVTPKDK